MKQEQLPCYDAITPVPELWDCHSTCKRFGERTDFPEWLHGEERCQLPGHDDLVSIIFDNTCHMYCKLYVADVKEGLVE